jgi:hypothetical protein
MANESSKLLPPYVGFGVFKSTTETLAATVVPSSALDRRVLHGISGADYGALLSALRFLGLVDEDKKATEEYRELIYASTVPENFQKKLFEVLSAAYIPVIGEVDFRKGTATELEKAFKAAGVSTGQMLTKTMRFYVKALQESGIEVSPHITKAKPRVAKPRVNANAAKNGVDEGNPGKGGIRTGVSDSLANSGPPEGFARLPIPGISEGFVQYPASLTEAQCEMYAAVITLLRAYATGLAGGKEKRV